MDQALKKRKWNEYEMKYNVQGRVAYICPKCNHINIFYSDVKTHVFSSDAKVDFVDVSIKYICGKCGNEQRVKLSDSIDIALVEVIRRLNNKGYTTLYSCSGDDSDPYIMFACANVQTMMQYNELVEKYPLPDLWYVEPDMYASEGKFTIRASHFTSFNDQVIMQIDEWSNELPDKADMPNPSKEYTAYKEYVNMVRPVPMPTLPTYNYGMPSQLKINEMVGSNPALAGKPAQEEPSQDDMTNAECI